MATPHISQKMKREHGLVIVKQRKIWDPAFDGDSKLEVWVLACAKLDFNELVVLLCAIMIP